MKHLFFVVAILLSLQIAVAQTKYAVKAGWNYSTGRVTDNGIKQPSQYKSGFGVAVLLKVPFEHDLHFSPYFGYNLRGFSYKQLTGFLSKRDYTIHYIDLVPALSYDLPVHKNSIVLSLGPQFGIALSGKEKLTDINNSTYTRKMKFSTESDYGRIDVGLSASIGYHLKKVFVEIGYQLGLANINNNEDAVNITNDPNTGMETRTLIDPRNIRHRMISLNIGYYLK